ncbi:MAG: tol-pal system YbgF family protein [Sandaracinaceae bacterium]
MFDRGKLRVLIVAWAVLTTSVATAQQPPDTAEQQARVLFQRAVAHYESGEFERAAVMLEEAIALHDIAVLHHNLGRALQEMGRWEEARAEYVLYLDREPDSPQRPRVEARLAQLDERIAEQRRTEAVEGDAVGVEPTLPSRDASSPSPVPWVVLGVGVAALVSAIPFGVLFDDAVMQSRAAADHRAAAGPAADAEVYAVTADALLIAGGALALAGLIWGTVEVSATTSVDVALGPTGVVARGAF